MMVIRDSNAIRDFYTCASLLNEPLRSKLQNVIRDYAALRLEAARDSRLDQSGFEALLKRFQQMRDQMTRLIGGALRFSAACSRSTSGSVGPPPRPVSRSGVLEQAATGFHQFT
jgi:hypothetical protein